jgi:serine/threonine protein kinase
MHCLVQIVVLRSLDLDFNYVEQVSCFVVGRRDSYNSGGRQQYCIAVEQPSLTLDRVVAGMLKNDACRANSDLRRKYVIKMVSVLRIVAKSLHRLHSVGVVHGNLAPEACGKFGDRWKLLRVFGFQKVGQVLDTKRCAESVPPEVLEPHNNAIAVDGQVALRNTFTVDPSMDIWGFGKLAYDVLVGQPLVEGDPSKELHNDQPCLSRILHWSTLDLVEVRHRLRKVEVPDAAVYLITKCLSQDPSNRPSISEVLSSDLWDNIHQRAPPADMSSLHEC